MSERHVLEGTWTGYVASQCRVVHREVVSAKRAERLSGLRRIIYTDGTSLLLAIRPAEPRERITEIRSYDALIRQAEATGKSSVSVAELP
jgi:hypothetical protein